jgi:hypothetical protein
VPLSLTIISGSGDAPRSDAARGPRDGPQRTIDHQRGALPAEVVDHDQDSQAAAVAQDVQGIAIGDKDPVCGIAADAMWIVDLFAIGEGELAVRIEHQKRRALRVAGSGRAPRSTVTWLGRPAAMPWGGDA